MIQRVWRGYAAPGNATAYEALLKEEVYAAIKAKNINGFKGMQLLRKDDGDEVAFMTIMLFDDMEAIRQFAGEDCERAFVPPGARQLLTRYDEYVTHYELVLQLS